MKIVYLVTEDWYFCSHRIDLATAAHQRGDAVAVATRVQAHGDTITSRGLELIPMDIDRRRVGFTRELRLIAELVRLYRELQPDVVHHVALKPVLYGSIAARLARVPRSVNAFAGLGLLTSSQMVRTRAMRRSLLLLFRMVINGRNDRVIVQNPDDFAALLGTVDIDRLRLIRGSGVDIDEFAPRPEPTGRPVVLLASRLLWEKGIEDYVLAARSLKGEGVDARFLVAGTGDEGNSRSIPDEQMRAWHADGTIEWLGRRDDMADLIAESTIVCLPSYYGEGVPKVLLEAAASGRAIVTTHNPGCREVVDDGVNGYLVSPHNSVELATAIRKLLDNSDVRREMGRRGRTKAVEEFSLDGVIRDTLRVYDEKHS